MHDIVLYFREAANLNNVAGQQAVNVILPQGNQLPVQNDQPQGADNPAQPGDTNQAQPGDTNQAQPGETNQAQPGESLSVKPGEMIPTLLGEGNLAGEGNHPDDTPYGPGQINPPGEPNTPKDTALNEEDKEQGKGHNS